ncbi:hypothetical protein EG68_04744 [Paragonimus skrjabini miyazakii]|uniref:Tyrosine-protein phosphatase domain-containing protein n=1 Tax=Paragonimus skrjabini miyazakii TaxID=59628 RepID=A0A8S9YZ71_9TREM|nr:hypothetical protein EG68_04744 [Paragonimus skrjabini miyazakii]
MPSTVLATEISEPTSKSHVHARLFKVASAIKDNDFIYHESVPSVDSLEQIKPACLVRGVAFDHNDPEIRGADIFQRLVPMKTLEATSIYSEHKASLLRSIVSEVEDKNISIQQFLASIDLDPLTMLAPDPPLPQALYDACARLNGLEGGPEKILSERMQALTTVSVDTDGELQNARNLLDDVKVRTDAILAIKTSNELKTLNARVRSFLDRFQGLSETLRQAKQSNIQLRGVLEEHISTWKRLTAPVEELASELPSVDALVNDPEASQTLSETQRLFGKVDEMCRQRAELVDRLRQALHEDDVTGDLLTLDTDQCSVESWFSKRLKKHDPLVGLIRQNLAAQENIESALIDINASFAPRGTQLREIRTRRAEELQKLISSGKTFEDLLERCNRGLDFYEQSCSRLKETIAELKELTEKLRNEEQKLLNLGSPPGATMVRHAYPPLPSSKEGFAPPAQFAHIPTLGDYMKSWRARPTDMSMVRQLSSEAWSAAPVAGMMHPINPVASIPGQPLTSQTPPVSGPTVGPTALARPSPFATPLLQYGTRPFGHVQSQSVRPPHLLAQSASVPSLHPSSSAPVTPATQPVSGLQPPPSSQNRPMQPVSAMPMPVIPPAHHPPLIRPLSQLNQPVMFPTHRMGDPTGRPSSMAAPSPPAGPNGSNFSAQTRQSPPAQISSPGPTAPSHYTFGQQLRPIPSSLSPRQSYHTGTQMPQPSIFPACSSRPQSTFGSTTVIPQSASYPAHLFAPRPPVTFSGQSPYVNFHPSIQPAAPSGHISITPSGGQPPQHQQLIGTHPGPLANYQPTQMRHPMPAPTTRPVLNPISTGIAGPVPVPQQYGQPSQQLHSSVASNVDWRPPNIVHSTQSQIESFAGYQRFQPLSSTGSAIQPVLATNPTQSAQPSTHESSNQAHILETNSNHVQLSLSATAPVVTDFVPLQPHVLTKAELDAQRREERLRATYGSQPSVDSTAINSPASVGSVTASFGPTINTNPVISASSNSVTMLNPNPVSTAEPNRDAGRTVDVSAKSVEPEPLSDPLVLNRFIAATENLLTWLENLNEPFPGATAYSSTKPAPTKLDAAWTRVINLATDYQSALLFKGKKPTQAAALCCSSKNRHQDFVPFDANRVVLDSSKNDYINASHIDFLGTVGEWCPRYIIAQAPMQKTVVDFWNMIISQGCEVVVLLLPYKHSRPGSPLSSFSNANPGEGGYGDPSDPHHIPTHLPLNKVGARFSIPGSSLEIRLQAIKESTQNDGSGGLRTNGSIQSDSGKSESWTERILTVHNVETQQTRSLVHLCYHGSILQAGSNTSIEHGAEHLCAFINHVHTYYKQQRSLVRPIAVICEYGAGSSGIFVTASVGLLHAERLGRVADVVDIAGYLCQQRRGALNHPSQLVIAARIIAHAAVETVARRDVVVGPRRYSSSASTHNVLNSKAGTVTLPVSEASPSANLIDTLFSGRTLQLNELMSVVDKWTVGGNSVAPEQSPDNHGDSMQNSLMQQEVAKGDAAVHHPCESNVDGLLVLDLDSSGVRSSETPGDVIGQQQQKQVPPIDHLVELSSLTAADSSPRFKRYTRHEFQSATKSPVSTTEDLFAQLDPLVMSK